MGILRDVLETLRDLKTVGNLKEYMSKRKYSSVSRRSLEGTLQFPVIASRSMDIDTLQMTSKALERQFASFIQVAMTMDPIVSLRDDKDVAGYLKKFHQNIGTRDSLDDAYGMFTPSKLFENAVLFSNEKENMYLFSILCEGSSGGAIKDNKDQLMDIRDHLNMKSLNEMFVPAKPVVSFPDKDLSDYHNNIVTEADGVDDYRKERDAISDFREERRFQYQQNKDLVQTKMDVERLGLERDKLAASRTPRALTPKDTDITYVPTNILKDNDVRKANEMVPTTLHIRTALFDENRQQQGFFDFVIGIKTTLHPLSSEEILTNLVSAAKNNSKAFSFIRWTTGEISFFKDFLLNIKEVEDDVFNRSAGSSGWWITLKRRKALAKIRNNTFMSGRQLLPNTTIVISMDEAEHLKSTYGYDVMDESFVDRLMKQYFLLSFVVIDNAAQIGHFMFDGQLEYQTYTFSALEKENTNKADIKEVMKMINRSNMI